MFKEPSNVRDNEDDDDDIPGTSVDVPELDKDLWGKGKTASRLAKNSEARLKLIEPVSRNYA